MTLTRRPSWLFPAAAVALGCAIWFAPNRVELPEPTSVGYVPYGPPHNHPLVQSVPDDRPSFRIDPDKPWQIGLGRGSGWHGLDTVTVDQDGRVVLYGLRYVDRGDGREPVWETATLHFSPVGVDRVLAAVEDNHLMGLHRKYRADVYDGTQWVLWIRQGERVKTVYCDNHFPDPIVRFAQQLDDMLAAAAGWQLQWEPVPPRESRGHEREFWDCVKQ